MSKDQEAADEDATQAQRTRACGPLLCSAADRATQVHRDIRDLARLVRDKKTERKALMNLAQWHLAWSRRPAALRARSVAWLGACALKLWQVFGGGRSYRAADASAGVCSPRRLHAGRRACAGSRRRRPDLASRALAALRAAFARRASGATSSLCGTMRSPANRGPSARVPARRTSRCPASARAVSAAARFRAVHPRCGVPIAQVANVAYKVDRDLLLQAEAAYDAEETAAKESKKPEATQVGPSLAVSRIACGAPVGLQAPQQHAAPAQRHQQPNKGKGKGKGKGKDKGKDKDNKKRRWNHGEQVLCLA